jgi:hypothetical protein
VRIQNSEWGPITNNQLAFRGQLRHRHPEGRNCTGYSAELVLHYRYTVLPVPATGYSIVLTVVLLYQKSVPNETGVVVYCIRFLLDNTIYSGHTCSRHTPGARTPLCRPRPTSPQRSAHHFLVVEHGQWSTSAVGDGEKRDCRTDRSPRHCGARASQTMYVKKKI